MANFLNVCIAPVQHNLIGFSTFTIINISFHAKVIKKAQYKPPIHRVVSNKI